MHSIPKNMEAMSLFKRSLKKEPEWNRYCLNARGVYCVCADACKGDSIAFEECTASAMNAVAFVD